MCHRLMYLYVPVSVSRVSLPVRMWSVDSSLVTFLYPFSPFVLSTRMITFLAYAFLYLARRLVSMLTFIADAFSYCSLSTRLSSRYS